MGGLPISAPRPASGVQASADTVKGLGTLRLSAAACLPVGRRCAFEGLATFRLGAFALALGLRLSLLFGACRGFYGEPRLPKVSNTLDGCLVTGKKEGS